MKKQLIILHTLVLMLIYSVAVNAATSITDSAGLLNQAQIQQLNDKIRQVEQKHDIKIGIVTQKSINNQDVNKVSKYILNSNFNTGKNGNIVLLIAMDSREWSISDDDIMGQRISLGEGFDYIENQVLSRLSANDYAGAFDNYINSVDKLLDYYEQNGQPYGAATSNGGFNPMAAMIAVVVSTIIGIMFRSSLIASMSNVRPAIEASEYLDKNSVNINESRDTFLYMNVQRRAKSSSRSSGGRSSGGGGGSRGGSF